MAGDEAEIGRPRRAGPVRLRVRIDLAETKPPVWRRLELASDLMLDEVHLIMQTAFGWTDSHLHQFVSGPSYRGPDAEYYLRPFLVEEGDDGVPEDQVRLDELLVEVGDKLGADPRSRSGRSTVSWPTARPSPRRAWCGRSPRWNFVLH